MPGGGPLLETNNTLEHPSGPEYQLVLGEGTYVLKDDLHLATPPPHPSDAPQPNHNPLAPSTGPPTTGTKLSIATLAPRTRPSQTLFRTMTSQSTRSNMPPSGQEEAQSPRSDAGSTANGFGSTSYSNPTPGFGDGNPALVAPVNAKAKKEQKIKPKNNIVKSNSSFVSRVILHDSLQKRLAERSADGMFAFANVNRAFMWLDLSSEIKAENMTKVLFAKAHALCHDVNHVTTSTNHVDIVLGFNTSDIMWYEPMSQKYARLNKNGMIDSSAVSCIKWLPHKESLFVAAHTDGCLVVYDKEKEDGELMADEPWAVESGQAHPHGEGRARVTFQVKKSVQSRNQKANPVAAWRLSNMKINDMAFSPDGRLLAVVSEDGCLSIFDYIEERVLDVYRSYYGAMLCVTWSPDGRYVLSGGQDDLVSIWSVADHAIVARCVGHQSWVTDVTFDPWRCDERNYRFGSVGEDCRLLLWDFSAGMVGRPKTLRPRGSISRHMPGERHTSATTTAATATTATTGGFRSNSNLTPVPTADPAASDAITHPVDPKASTAVLPPVMSKHVDEHPLCWLGFEADCILTSCHDGHVREWTRPGE